MKTRISAIAASFILILAMLACGAPTGQNSNNHQSNLAGTITAQALIIQSSTNPVRTKRPIVTRTPRPKVTATAMTTTPTIPMVSVSSPTNCRTGPSTDYDLIDSLNVGESAEVVGKYTEANYWIIKTPSGGGNCWLWGQYATITGNTDNLPEMVPPPAPPTAVPAPIIPATPKSFGGDVSCKWHLNGFVEEGKVHSDLHWTDAANNEDGYHIYRDGKLLATLDANSTTYSENTNISYIPGFLGATAPTLTYAVEAFNGAGTSNQKDVTLACP